MRFFCKYSFCCFLSRFKQFLSPRWQCTRPVQFQFHSPTDPNFFWLTSCRTEGFLDLDEEIEEGNIEYKWKLVDPTPERLEHVRLPLFLALERACE
jgi:hypothetical protein